MTTITFRREVPAEHSWALYERDKPAVYGVYVDGVRVGHTRARQGHASTVDWQVRSEDGRVLATANSRRALAVALEQTWSVAA